ncbi:MAG: Dam family site-specific DNA-(adenine-N6)-methyltransferase [Hyphomonadaceae bacterium]
MPQTPEATDIVFSPIVRWAGSKSKLIPQIEPYLPASFRTYIEPFFGSGALFFHLAPKRAYLSDLCTELVETYTAVRDNHQLVADHLSSLKLNKRTYYALRAQTPRGRYKAAARFLYLNRACWNGLYRVNTMGRFNVPYGRPRSKIVFYPENLRGCSELLSRPAVDLKVGDFETTLRRARSGDFVFLDPPYVTKHNLNGFAEWNERIFSWRDQQRLADLATQKARDGVEVLVTNADHDDVISLYPGFKRYRLSRHSTLAGDMSKRGVVTEAILRGGPSAA